MSAEQILSHMAKIYRECKTYRDSGHIKAVAIDGATKRRVIKNQSFTTAFVRPYRFRFECKWQGDDKRENRSIIWRKASSVWWNLGVENDKLGKLEEVESLDYAVRVAAGVTLAASRTVPALLLPDQIHSTKLTDIEEAKRLEDTQLGKVNCFRIKGKYAGYSIDLWIDKTTYAVLRIDDEDNPTGYKLTQTTTYQPVFDGSIPEEMLKINLPKH